MRFNDNRPLRIAIMLFGIYLLLLSIKMMGHGFKAMGEGFAEQMITTTSNPFVGLFIGILVTSVVQSSSCTTSLVVALVGGGVIGIGGAIPIIMGANIGTTVTNTIVSFGHALRRQEFKRAFGGATVHDIFNLLAVLTLLPIELIFHPIEWTASRLTDAFYGAGGVTFTSPLRYIVHPVKSIIVDIFSLLFYGNPVPLIIFSIACLFIALKIIVDSMRVVVLREIEILLDDYLFKNDFTAFGVGFLFTAIVQSSSVTTSIVVPLVGAGILGVSQVFPYVLGANIGTTVTAILASLALTGEGAKAGVTAAFAHLVFNIFGILIWYPLRKVPIELAERLSDLVMASRKYAVIYVLVVFYLIPLLLIFLEG